MKKRGRHTSLDKDLKRSVEWLEQSTAVAKVVIGISEICRHSYSPGHLKVMMDKDGGFSMKGYGGNGITNMFVKVDPIEKREEIKQKIKEKF